MKESCTKTPPYAGLTYKIASDFGVITKILAVRNGFAVLGEGGSLEMTTYPCWGLESFLSVELMDSFGNERLVSATLFLSGTRFAQAETLNTAAVFLAAWPHGTLRAETCIMT